MPGTVAEAGKGRLERSCTAAGGERIRMGAGAEGLERLEAHLLGQAFSPHRHDSYAIGITLAGVQSFRYRGAARQCLPGQWHVLHPDELHDGGAGTDAGFGYRILYIDPALIQQALGGRPLPFLPDPVLDAAFVPQELADALKDLDEQIDDLSLAEIAAAAAQMLAGASTDGPQRAGRLRLEALARLRDCIRDEPQRRTPVAALEKLAGLDRFTLARQFRAAFGTSPGRFRTMRRLDLARSLLREGTPPAEAALAAGFADQSHLTRQFKRAYGMTPARWAAAVC